MTGKDLKEKIAQQNISALAIAKKLGISPQALNSTFNAADVKSGTLERIAEVLGVGMSFFYPMEGSNAVASGNVNVAGNDIVAGCPFYGNLPVSAGKVIQYPDIMRQIPTGAIDIPQARGAEFFFPVIGMSMKPTIDEGDIIGVCHIDRYETTNADRVYMIITRDNERMIKRILKYNKKERTVTLGSDNPHFPTFDLDIDMIVDVYKVVLHLKVETL